MKNVRYKVEGYKNKVSKKLECQEVIAVFIKGVKNFFPMPNLIFSLGLSGAEIALYMYLMYIEDREKHTCHPSFKTIGKALKMSKTTVKKYVDSLVEKQMISVEQTSIVTKSGIKRNGTLLYTILPIQNALDYYNEQQAIIAQNQNKNPSDFYCRNKQRGC